MIRRPSILIVDDDQLVLRAYQRMLGVEYEVTTVLGGMAAIELLRRRGDDFDAILCDVMMPIVDGIGVYQTVVAEMPHVAERIIFSTGGTTTDRARSFFASATQIRRIDKDFDRHHLRMMIAELCDRPPTSQRDS